MAIAFRNFTTGSAINGGNITLDLTGKASVGDIVLIGSSAFGRAGNEGRIGNALSYSQFVDVTATQRLRCARKIFATGEESVTVEGSGDANDATAAYCFTFSGVDPTTPLDVTTTTASASIGNADPPSITPTSNDCMIVVLGASDANDAAPGTMASYTQTATPGVVGVDTNFASAAGTYRLLSGGAGSPENPAAWSGWASDWVVATIALRPNIALTVMNFFPVSAHVRRNIEMIGY